MLGLTLGTAHAVDGTIIINGEIIDQTCKINGREPQVHIIVSLPKISTSALKSVGDTAGATPFVIKLTECPAALSGNVKAYFEPGFSTDYDNGSLYAYVATGIDVDEAQKVDNLGVQLANPDGQKIELGGTSSFGAEAALSTTKGAMTKEATLRYLARYVKTGTGNINAGKIVTYVQYSIVYP
ncbi:fimbrial protein [Bordetella pseudohinzii]|uniref:Putative fimbrial protein SthA n=1 Tax=Bordetella pseudohinzii TaxID=1331258 RepID=A0A0J6BYU9_9BORD|nr:fimbrial protein [Bordetella pseudohinzii]ANY17792.1 hypothetical protein BBN53_19020 [Bordetella pseudohinzii]KMM23838.1 hypothetical protein L540_11545 [Bordetella pseudohinzii]KXA75383.1 hypothetical protein AW877_20035 [Bordetella pseudohinzii]KXA76216.1 hypothetical protein AW878_18620 [Bordetella pseudohinzii]CUI76871.1 putative fimbrial protein SthA [Bordetella pseudohinzii]